MKSIISSVSITLVAVGLAVLVRAQSGPAPASDPKLEDVLAKLPTPGSGDVFVRTIPADVLRDYPGVCFSYNNNKFFNVNETWRIEGVCAMAECMALPINRDGQLGLFEQVFDCGPRVVKEVKECSYTREEDLTKKFPDCCPTFTCTDGFNPRDLLRPSGGPPAAAADAKADAPAQ